MTIVLEDQDARDRIARDLDATLIVEAAAGTGKTTALVDRILSLLRSGKATLKSLVAVTFTEKAAGEMKLRLRTEIERARRATSDERESARFNHALTELEAAHIGTIHAFCADLLRERPVEAEVDPLFEVASEDESDRVYDEAFSRWFQETLQAPGDGVSRVLRRAARERDQDGPRQALRRAGRTLIEQRDFPTPYEKPSFNRPAALDRVVDGLRTVAAHAPKGFADSWLTKSLQEIGRVVFEIDRREETTARDYDAIEAHLQRLARHKCWGWRGSGQWFNRAEGITCDHVRSARAAAKADLDDVLRATDGELAALLFSELWGIGHGAGQGKNGLVARYEDLKSRSGKLDFLDLLVRTRDLLLKNAAVRHELSGRFSHLLVDEFQDTDPLQAEILLLLAAGDPTATDWTTIRPIPGKLFFVGDPKQSIYRFRRADVSLYETLKARLLDEGASLVLLQTSFRSAPSIQSFVNAAFDPLMKPNERRSQASYVPLKAFRSDPVGQPSLVALPVPRPYSDFGRVTNWKIEESFPDAVGAFVDWLVNESGWTVSERGSDDRVPIASRHVCLLFKRLQSFGNDTTRPYVRALEVRRIPHVLVGGRSFHEREEIIALRSSLAAVEWPDDTLSVYATIRGPFFAVSDDAILAFRHTYKHLHPMRGHDKAKLTELTKPVADALDVLATLHVGRNRRPIADTIARLLDATRAHAGIAIWPAGEQALGNLLRVLDMARRFEQGAVTSFRAFVSRLEDDAERGGVNEAPVVEEGTDGVRIMTVHKSKGLEFPVVVIVDPTAPATFREPTRHVDTSRKLWAVPLCGASPKELSDRREEILAEDREEAVRLLYVATTRARELLVLPVVGDPRDDAPDGWLEPLADVLSPSERRKSGPAPGCPTFGEDTVVFRPETASRGTYAAVRPGLHRPVRGTHEIVYWDPHVLRLDREDDVGIRQEKILAVDERGVAAKEGIEQHAVWSRGREKAVADGARPSVVVTTVTALKDDAPADARPAGVVIAATASTRKARPHGKRFGVLAHAILATVALDADAQAISDVARIQGRVVGASEEEVAAARDAVAEALAHPLLARARAAVRAVREAPVMMKNDDGSILEGVIDLAFLEQDVGWTVVDFKTDVEIGSRGDAYVRQVDAYARALSSATNTPATGALLSI